MFIAALFTVIKLWSQPRCSLVSDDNDTGPSVRGTNTTVQWLSARLAAPGVPSGLQLLSGFAGRWWQVAEVLWQLLGPRGVVIKSWLPPVGLAASRL